VKEPVDTLIQKFAAANVVVATSGSSLLAYLMFLRPKATIVELSPASPSDWSGAHLCRGLGFTHHLLETNQTTNRKLHPNRKLLATLLPHLPPTKKP